MARITAAKGLLGGVSSGGAIAVASLPQIADWLRVCGAGAGIVVAVFTAISLGFDIRKKYRESKKVR